MSDIHTISDIKDRCVIDFVTGCWNWSMYCEPKTGRPAMRMEVEHGVNRCVRLSIALHIINTGRKPPNGARIYYPAVCRNNQCANPDHQRLMTQGQINKLVGGHGPVSRAKIGAANYGKGKLSMQARDEIIGSTMPLAEIMERYGISKGYASTLRRGLVGRPPAAPGSSVFAWRPDDEFERIVREAGQ